MAEENEKSVPEESGKKKKGNAALYSISVIPIMIMLAFFLVAKVINPRFAPPPADAANLGGEGQDGSHEGEGKEGFICDLGTVIVNPVVTQRIRIMKVGVSIEVTSQMLLEMVEKEKTKLQHQLIMILSSKQLSEVCLPEGKTNLQEELRQKFISELGCAPDGVRQVYFGEFIIQ